jgi:uncharacterized membrane protein SpoIIM required for sporulation
MFSSMRPAWMIMRREVGDQFRDWRIIFPIAGLTLFFPFLMNFTAQQILGFVGQYGANIIGERLVPFLLMIVGFFPISVSLVIALETFVGEKERGSIEPLLNTPLLDWQLYVGKLMSAIVYPLGSSYAGMAVYLFGLYINHITLPDAGMLVLVFTMTTVQAILMVAGAVVVSSQTTSVRAANLLASFIVIPVALLIQGESIVLFWGNTATLWWGVFGLFLLTVLLVRVGLAHFQREELLGHEIDVLNFRWGWKVFRNEFRGNARNVGDWYRREVPSAVRSLRLPFILICCLAVAGVFIGYSQVDRFRIPLESSGLVNLSDQLKALTISWPIFSFGPVLLIFWQNLRVLLLALLLGLFSFGIVGVIPLMATLGITGYLMGLLQQNGLSVGLYLVGFILPHGIIEIPAAILACAAVLQAGAIMATPTPGKTIGEALISALAVWCKVMVGIVVPLLLISAMIEAWVTPRLALWLFR